MVQLFMTPQGDAGLGNGSERTTEAVGNLSGFIHQQRQQMQHNELRATIHLTFSRISNPNALLSRSPVINFSAISIHRNE